MNAIGFDRQFFDPQKRLAKYAVLILTVILSSISPASANASARDLAIAVRAIDFVRPKPSGGSIAVIFDPSDPSSKSIAEAVAATMPTSTKRIAIQATPVAIEDMAAINRSDAVFLPSGLSNIEPFARALAGQGLLCFTTERAYVEAGHCVMSVTSSPKVEILVGMSAAQAYGVAFGNAFRMMIKEI